MTGTSIFVKSEDKELIEEYRKQTFGSDAVGLRHAIRDAIKRARGNEE